MLQETQTTTAVSAHNGLADQPPTIPFYAVRMGHKPGVYTDREMAILMLTNYPDSNAKEFNNDQEAQAYMQSALTGGLHTVDAQSQQIKVIYTSGMCEYNGYANARGGIGVVFGAPNICNFTGPLHGTKHSSQRAELAAVYQALRIVWTRRDFPRWEIRTDSHYVIQCLTLYLDEWKRNGWKTAQGQPVENQEYILAIDKLRKKLTFKGIFFNFQLVGAQSGDRWIASACQLARRGVVEPDFVMPESEKESRSRRGSS